MDLTPSERLLGAVFGDKTPGWISRIFQIDIEKYGELPTTNPRRKTSDGPWLWDRFIWILLKYEDWQTPRRTRRWAKQNRRK